MLKATLITYIILFTYITAHSQVAGSTPDPTVSNSINRLGSAEKVTYLALGDSYTVGAAESRSNSYPSQLVNRLRKMAFNMDTAYVLAKIGWTTQDLIAGLQTIPKDQKFAIVTVLIGVNDQFRHQGLENYKANFADILRSAISLCKTGAKQVFVLSIPDWSVTPFGKLRNPDKVTSEIEEFNTVNKQESKKMGVNYINITSISLNADQDMTLTANDGLHPSGKMYAMWVKKISDAIKNTFK